MNEPLTLVSIAHEQYRLAMGEYHRKRNSYLTALAFARDEGESYAAIGRVVGCNRQRVFDLIHGKR